MIALLLACTSGGAVLDAVIDTGKDESAPPDTDSATPTDDTDVEQIPGVGHPSDILFMDDELPSFDVLLSDEAFNSLIASPYEWVEGGVIFQGETYAPIGIRCKGENSFMPITEKCSLKLSFDRIDEQLRFYKLEGITLNNMNNDASMMHERLAYRHFREAGLPAYRSNHALVSINGEHVGLYALLEDANKDFLKRWYDTPDGPMYEVWDVDFYDHYISSFQLEVGDDDRTQLQGVADAMELDDADDAYAAAAEHLDWDQFADWWAAEITVGQYDSYPYANPGDDCHVFVNQDNGSRLEWIPHGMDETYYYPEGVNVFSAANGIVAKTCIQVDECKDKVVERLNWHLDLADEIETADYFDYVEDQVNPHVKDDDNKPYSNDYVWYYQDLMRDFITGRRNDLSRWTD